MERKFRITVNGRSYDVTVEELTEGTSYVLPQPGDMRVPEPAPTDAPEHADNELPSPLAGTVDSVQVAAGEAVVDGQALLVIDAMKMKTTIVANRSGTIDTVYVAAGDTVDGGQALLSFR